MARGFPREFPFDRDESTAVTASQQTAGVKPAVPVRGDVAYGGPERRRSVRGRVGGSMVVREDRANAAQRVVTLEDISLHGVGWFGDEPVDRGSCHLCRFEAGPLRWSGRVQVVHVRAQGARYFIGAAFTQRILYAAA